jgi:CheY-like chemotaxis protein
VDCQSSNTKTILIVEDEALIRLVIAKALRDAEFKVLEANTADEALTKIQSGALIHLVFADVRMPGSMNGIELMTVLRKHYPELKLVVASGYSPDWPSPFLADDFIGKPYDVARTVERIKTLLGSE